MVYRLRHGGVGGYAVLGIAEAFRKECVRHEGRVLRLRDCGKDGKILMRYI